jgi:hypothetical protein
LLSAVARTAVVVDDVEVAAEPFEDGGRRVVADVSAVAEDLAREWPKVFVLVVAEDVDPPDDPGRVRGAVVVPAPVVAPPACLLEGTLIARVVPDVALSGGCVSVVGLARRVVVARAAKTLLLESGGRDVVELGALVRVLVLIFVLAAALPGRDVDLDAAAAGTAACRVPCLACGSLLGDAILVSGCDGPPPTVPLCSVLLVAGFRNERERPKAVADDMAASISGFQDCLLMVDVWARHLGRLV